MSLRDLLFNPKFLVVLALAVLSTSVSIFVSHKLIQQQARESSVIQQTKSLSMELLEARKTEYETKVQACEISRVVEKAEYQQRLEAFALRIDSIHNEIDSVIRRINTNTK